MVPRVSSLIVCGLLAGLLPTCLHTVMTRVDPLGEVRKQVGAPVQEVARMTGDYGQVVLFTYRKGDDCGFGQAYQSADGKASGSGSTAHGCVQQSPPAFEASAAGRYLPDGAKAAFPELQYGPVYDSRIVRMELTLADGRKLPATMTEGFWYIQLPEGSEKTVSIAAWDRAGAIVDTDSTIGRP